MCIIAVKLATAKHPSIEEIAKMWQSNPHGAGIAYPDVDGGVSIVKGLMTLEAFMEAAKPLLEIPNSFYVMHFRIATHGSTGPDMTHPFWIKDGRVALAHNGILPYSKQLEKDDVRSDTAAFVQDILANLPENWYESNKWCHLVEEYMGWNNKFAVIEPRGVVLLNRSAWTDDKDTGMIYSNGSYKVYKQQTGGNQASNFRQPKVRKSGTSGGSAATTTTDFSVAAEKRTKALLDIGKRCGALVNSGMLTVPEAQKIVGEVRAHDWMPEECEDFLDFYVRAKQVLKKESPTLLWALDLLNISSTTDMARVPDVLLHGKAMETVDELEQAQVESPDEAASILKGVISVNVSESMEDTPVGNDPIRLWDDLNAVCFVGKRVRITLADGQTRIGTCDSVSKAGLSYHRHDGGYGTAYWDYIDDIESCMVLNNPQFRDLSTHLGCMVSVSTATGTGFSGQLTSLNPTNFTVKGDMGVNFVADYSEVLSVTIDAEPPKYLENKG